MQSRDIASYCGNPHPRRAIIAGSQEGLAIGGEHSPLDSARMTREMRQLPPGLEIPQARGVVVAGREGGPAIRREGNSIQRRGVTGQTEDFLSGLPVSEWEVLSLPPLGVMNQFGARVCILVTFLQRSRLVIELVKLCTNFIISALTYPIYSRADILCNQWRDSFIILMSMIPQFNIRQAIATLPLTFQNLASS